MKRFWVTCQECGDSWIASFIEEHGCLFAVDEIGETCAGPDGCGGDVVIDEEYDRETACDGDDDRDEVAFDF